MPHIHWVARQNKLEIPNEKDEFNKREIHKCDGQAHDPHTMVAPPAPKPTRKAEALAKAPPIIASSREEDAALKKWPKPRLCCASCILETKAKVGSTAAKAPAPRANYRVAMEKPQYRFSQKPKPWQEVYIKLVGSHPDDH